MNSRCFLVAACLAVAGCAGGPPEVGLAPNVEYVQTAELPSPADVGPDGSYLYALGPLDKVQVEIFGLSDMSRELIIDAQGNISVPIVGAVRAAGLTPVQLADVLEAELRQNFVRDPDVIVNLLEVTSNYITVDGQVKRPGLYPVHRDQTLTQLIAQAGGESEFARVSTVIVFREVNGQEYVGLYNVGAIRYGNYADPAVYPGDKVVVDESRTRRFLDNIQGVTQLLTTPLILLQRTI